jgi:hypothetical protein
MALPGFVAGAAAVAVDEGPVGLPGEPVAVGELPVGSSVALGTGRVGDVDVHAPRTAAMATVAMTTRGLGGTDLAAGRVTVLLQSTCMLVGPARTATLWREVRDE